MDFNKLIGEGVITRGGEVGTISKVDQGDIIIYMCYNKIKAFTQDSFKKGFVKFQNAVIQKSIETESVQEQQHESELALREKLIYERNRKLREQTQTVEVVKTKKLKTIFNPDWFKNDKKYHIDFFNSKIRLTSKKVDEQLHITKSNVGRIKECGSKLVLISNIKKKKNVIVYTDRWLPNGDYLFTGEGEKGDQKLTGLNKKLYKHLTEGKNVLLFVKYSSDEMYFQGEYGFSKHMEETITDREGNTRVLQRFILKRVNK